MVDGFNELADLLTGGTDDSTVSSEATVTRIDDEGTVWVHFPGGVDETPVHTCLASVSPGDTVPVEIAQGRAAIPGNKSDVPAASSTVRKVAKVADHADEIAGQAVKDAANAQAVADEAAEVATATSQHFWTDTGGSHVTDVTQDEWAVAVANDFADQTDLKPYNNSLWNSLGMLFRRGLKNLVSITKSAITFYDGTGNDDFNIRAMFGTSGARINGPYINCTMASGDFELSFFDNPWFVASTSDTLKGWDDDATHIVWDGDTIESGPSRGLPYSQVTGHPPSEYSGETVHWLFQDAPGAVMYNVNFILSFDVSSQIASWLAERYTSSFYLVYYYGYIFIVAEGSWSDFTAGTAQQGSDYELVSFTRHELGNLTVSGGVNAYDVNATHMFAGPDTESCVHAYADDSQQRIDFTSSGTTMSIMKNSGTNGLFTAGNFEVGGTFAASNVGTRVTKDQSTAVSLTSNSWGEICNVSLGAGTWVVHGNVQFAANATGRRTVCLSTDASGPGTSDLRQRGMRVTPISSVSTYVNSCITVKLTSASTMHLYGEQTSGADLNAYGCITAVRIV